MNARKATAGTSPNDDLDAVLDVCDLAVAFPAAGGWITVVDDVSFAVAHGETVGIVGESGSGKTMTARAFMGLVPEPGRVTRGHVRLDGTDLLGLSRRELSLVRGRDIAMISQEPMSSLNPAFTVGEQIAETIRRHRRLRRRDAWRAAVTALDRVQIPNATRRARSYPHEFSGGMRQRVAIAMALSCDPDVLIADEPTTALDVTVQAQMLDLIRDLRAETGLSVVFITHDLGVVADICDRVVVMYAGQVVEVSAADPLFTDPVHPYTEALLGSLPGEASNPDSLVVIPGQPPMPGATPLGCRFHPRCTYATDICRTATPALRALSQDRRSRCVRIDELTLTAPVETHRG